MEKRGASLVIAWVLLLGLSISLAIGVFSWSKLKTEALTESSVTFVEGSLECNEVKISIKKIGECDSLNVYNRGKLSIEKLALSSLDGSSSEVMNANLVPLQNKVFDYSGPNVEEGIEVLPLVRIGDDLVACRNSRVLLDCLVLITIQTPFEGTPVKNTVEISAEVSEEEGVSVLTPSGMIVASAIDLITGEVVSEIEKVEFKIDGIIIGNPVTSPPYSIQWDTTKYSNGEHEITAVVTYKSGNKESSSPVKVIVDNAIVVSQPDPSPTTGTTYYVSTTGNDANTCEQAKNINTPKKTIVAGVACLTAGSKLEIRGGTYTEGYVGSELIPSGTSWNTATTISNYNGEIVIIMATPNSLKNWECGAFLLSNGKSYIIIQNLIFDGTNCGGSTTSEANSLALGNGVHHIRLLNIKSRNWKSNGLRSTVDTHHNEIINSEFYNNGFKDNTMFHGIYYEGDDSLFENLNLHDNGAGGIQFWNAGDVSSTNDGTADRNILRNSKIYNNEKFGLAVDGKDNQIYNNLIFKNSGSGTGAVFISGQPGSYRNKFYNNDVVYDKSGTALYVTGGNNEVKNNIFYSNVNDISDKGQNNIIANNLIGVDPKFVNPTATIPDFHLQTGSPAIDKGATLGSPYNVDLDGKTRPIGSAWDIGAYEYGTITNPISITTGVKAFPTAEGYGEKTIGGRGGRVIHVTNLNDNGPGSFRDALLSTGPRIIVFDVSGTIELLTSLEMRGDQGHSYVTVAGQTSPGGIQLKNFGILMYQGIHDVIIRHLRLRAGTFDAYPAGCGCTVPFEIWRSYDNQPVYNIIIDHSDLYWGIAKNFVTAGAITDVTLQWSILAEGTNTGHYYGTPHNDAILLDHGGGTRVNLHHNLLFDHEYRNPHVQRGITDFRNNYVYGWGRNNYAYVTNGYVDGQVVWINVVKNVYKRGPYSGPDENILFVRQSTETCLPLGSTQTLTKVYYKQNMGPDSVAPEDWDTLPPKDECNGGQPALSVTYESATPVMPEPVITETDPKVLWTTIKNTVGAYKPSRDALDIRIISETISGNSGALGPGADGLTFDWPTLTGGVAPTDTDQDGMPNSWETSHGLNPNDASDGSKTSSNGYTYVENYLNELAGDIVPAFT